MSSVSIVATVEQSNLPPRVRLDVTDTGNSPAITTANVTRVNPDGRTVPVRTFDGNPLPLAGAGPRVGLVYDYEMPYDGAVTYSTLETPANTSAAVTVAVSRAWIVHPGVPSLSMPIVISGISELARGVTRQVFQPMGRATSVVITDGRRKAASGSLTVLTQTSDERRALTALLDDAGTVLLNVPASLLWGVLADYIAVGTTTERRLGRFLGQPDRLVDMPFDVVDMPVGGSQSQRTLLDLLAFPTLDSLRLAYPTLTALLAGP